MMPHREDDGRLLVNFASGATERSEPAVAGYAGEAPQTLVIDRIRRCGFRRARAAVVRQVEAQTAENAR